MPASPGRAGFLYLIFPDSVQGKLQASDLWMWTAESGRRPSDKHMPSSVIIATCIVNAVVTFQLKKFQTLISLMVSLST